MNLYKIRHTVTGKFRKGSAFEHSWTKNGKVWIGTGPLRSHLTQAIDNGIDMAHWEVIEIEMTEVSVKPALDWVTPEKLIKLLTKK